MDGWEAGYSATHPLGMNGVVIAGASHANRIPNVTIQTLTVDNGLISVGISSGTDSQWAFSPRIFPTSSCRITALTILCAVSD
jgi:hypothetical protein